MDVLSAYGISSQFSSFTSSALLNPPVCNQKDFQKGKHLMKIIDHVWSKKNKLAILSKFYSKWRCSQEKIIERPRKKLQLTKLFNLLSYRVIENYAKSMDKLAEKVLLQRGHTWVPRLISQVLLSYVII